MPLITGLIATGLAVSDYFIAGLIYKGSSFLWVSFISWSAFGRVSLKERISAVPCLISGVLIAFLMNTLTSSLETVIKAYIVASCISIFIFNILIAYFTNLKKFASSSVVAIFIGLSLAFSGLGVGLEFDSIKSSLTMCEIILIYGVLGLIAGFLLGKAAEKFD